MNCKQVKSKLSAYQDKELSELQIAGIENHLQICSVCSQALQDMNDVWEVLSNVETIESAPFFWTQLSQQINEKDTKQSNRIFGFLPTIRLSFPILTTVVLIIGVFIGIYLGKNIYQHSVLPSTVITEQDLDQVISLGSFDDFPVESVAEVYVSLLSDNNQQ